MTYDYLDRDNSILRTLHRDDPLELGWGGVQMATSKGWLPYPVPLYEVRESADLIPESEAKARCLAEGWLW